MCSVWSCCRHKYRWSSGSLSDCQAILHAYRVSNTYHSHSFTSLFGCNRQCYSYCENLFVAVLSPVYYCLVGLVVRRPPRERKILGSNHTCARIFRGRVIPVTQKFALQWLPCQAPGVIGSVLGLVGPVSVYCDWVE